jgi:hypothetical protein
MRETADDLERLGVKLRRTTLLVAAGQMLDVAITLGIGGSVGGLTGVVGGLIAGVATSGGLPRRNWTSAEIAIRNRLGQA